MIAWAGWALLVSALLGLAALAAEKALGLYRRPRRWVWVTAMTASVALPLALLLVPAPPSAPPPADAGALVGPPLAIEAAADAPPEAPSPAERLAALGVRAFLPVWGATTVGLLAFLGLASARLARARRRWRAGEVAGVHVLETETLGPAVVGVFRPRIAIPGWVRELDSRLQALVVHHEREHQRAHDPRLLAAGLLACALVPWNLALWWQLRRLRLAIEVDCDRRVLAAGAPLADYGALLLEVGRRASARPLPLVALYEPRSFLERRLAAMLDPRPRRRLAPAILGILLSAGLAAAATTIPRPEPPVLHGELERSRGDTIRAYEYTEDPDSLPQCIEGCSPEEQRAFMARYLEPGIRCDGGGYGLSAGPDGRGVATIHRPSTVSECDEAIRAWARTTRWINYGKGWTEPQHPHPIVNIIGNILDSPRYAEVTRLVNSAIDAQHARFAERGRYARSVRELEITVPKGFLLHLEAPPPYDWVMIGQEVASGATVCATKYGRWIDVTAGGSSVSGGVCLPPSPAAAVQDTPRFRETPFDVRPRCLEGCSARAILASLPDAAEPLTCDVVVGIRIGRTGTVTGTDMVKSQPGCDEPVREWARSTRWVPATKDGHPVEVWIAQPVKVFKEGRAAESGV